MSEDNNQKSEFLTALLAVQTKLSAGIAKDSQNPHFKSQYADRTSILQFVLPVLHEHGFILTQTLVPPPVGQTDVLALNTTLYHVASGASVGETAVVPLPKSDPQGYGSAMTYTSRYAIVALFALPLLDDDDGNAASGKGKSESGAGSFKRTEAAKTTAKTSKANTSTSETPKDTATSTAASTPATTTAESAAASEPTAKPASNATSASKPTTTSLWGKK